MPIATLRNVTARRASAKVDDRLGHVRQVIFIALDIVGFKGEGRLLRIIQVGTRTAQQELTRESVGELLIEREIDLVERGLQRVKAHFAADIDVIERRLGDHLTAIDRV